MPPAENKPPPPSEPEKQTQKAILKRIVDPAGPLVKYMQNRCSLVLRRSSPWLQPTMAGALELLPPEAYPDMPLSSLTTRFVASTQNKTRCAIFCARFAPDGRRVLTGDNSGGICVWNSADFMFQQYLQAHNKAVRDISFTHNGNFVLAADDTGAVKISTINLKPLQEIKAHQMAVRAVSASPTDQMFASCSDDHMSPIVVWDLATSTATTLIGAKQTGHGGDVRSVDWHPCNSLLASCGRDSMVKLWDTRLDPDTALLATLQGHKQCVNKVCWNLNGTWLASCSRDLTVKVWDVRHTKREMASWQGHSRDISAVVWHPIHLDLLTSAGGDGSLMFWLVGQPESLTKVETAHENSITSLALHPMGHMLATCGYDGASKFWVRPRPADPWRGAQQSEQEETLAMLARLTPGGQNPQLPGLAGAGGGGAGGGAAGAARGGMPGGGMGGMGIPGLPNQQQQQQTGAGGGMGLVPPGGGIPGLPGRQPLPGGVAAAAVPGLGGPPGMQLPPGLPSRPLHAGAAAAGIGVGVADGGAGGAMGLLPGMMAGGGGMGGGRGGSSSRGPGGGGGGRGRGRGPMKRPRDAYDDGGAAAASHHHQHDGASYYPPAPKREQPSHHYPQQQQPSHYQQQQQQQHFPPPPHSQHHQMPPPHQQHYAGSGGPPPAPYGGSGGGSRGYGGRGYGEVDGGSSSGRGGRGGRGYGRGFGRGTRH